MTTTETKKSEEYSIFIGSKPFMNYVTGVIMQFNKGANEVVIKARGKFISKGVDVAEVARRKFLEEINIELEMLRVMWRFCVEKKWISIAQYEQIENDIEENIKLTIQNNEPRINLLEVSVQSSEISDGEARDFGGFLIQNNSISDS